MNSGRRGDCCSTPHWRSLSRFRQFWEGGSHPPKKQLPTRSKLEKLKLESWVAAGMYKDICHGGGKKLKAAAVDITVVLVGL